MVTPDEIEKRIADAFGRNIQDTIKGNVQAGTSPLGGYTIPVKIEGQVETFYAKYNPVANATILAEGTRVDLIYNELGELEIVDWDRVAARASYPNPPPSNLVLQQHNHQNAAGGGQLNASLVFSAGTVPVNRGGTGIGVYAVGDLIYASTTGVLSRLADVATGNALISGGVGAAPSYGKIGLTTHVSGTLPATNGGTGHAVYAVGDIVYASTTTALSRLADVATGNALISGGVGVAPAWGKIGLTTHVSGLLPLANGGTNADNSSLSTGALIAKTASTLSAATLTSGAVMIGGASGVPTFVSPGSDGDVLTVVGGAWASAAGGSGTSPWIQGTGEVYLDDPTDVVIVGDSGEDLGQLTIRGVADTPQFAIRFNGTQTQPGVLIQNAAVATVFSIGGDGAVTMNGSVTQDAGAYTFNSAGADYDGLFKGNTDDELVKIDAGLDMVGISEGTPTALLHAGASTTTRASMRMTTGTAPTSPNDGDIWNSDAQNAYMMYLAGMAGAFGKVIFTQTNTVSVNNTGTEGTLLGTGVGGLTLPANYLVAGKTLLIIAAGFFGTLGTTGALEIRVKIGGTAVVQGTDTVSSASDGTGWFMVAVVTCRTTGGSGTVFAQGAWFSEQATTHLAAVVAVTVDTTGTLAIDVSADWTPTNNGISCSNAMVIVLN